MSDTSQSTATQSTAAQSTAAQSSTTPATDPLTAMLMANPPKNAIEFRNTLDTMSLLLNSNLPDIGGTVDDVVIAEYPAQNLTVDIHRPKGNGPFPVLVYLHGGGWIMGTPKTHRKVGFRFAEAGYLTFNVHYRLAPESPFPAGYDDCIHALRWVREHAKEYGGDASRIAVGGDSAGGNLTAAVAASVGKTDPGLIKCILLIYPALDFASMDRTAGTLPGTDTNLVELMVGPYIGHDYDRLVKDPRVSPIHVGDQLPPALILCGTADTLIEDCKRLEANMIAAKRPHEVAYYDDMPHGFVQMEDFFPQARQSIERMVAFLQQRL